MLIYFRKVHFHHRQCPRPFHFLDFSLELVSLSKSQKEAAWSETGALTAVEVCCKQTFEGDVM